MVYQAVVWGLPEPANMTSHFFHLPLVHCCCRLMEHITAHQDSDPFVHPDSPAVKKANPWIERKSCTIL